MIDRKPLYYKRDPLDASKLQGTQEYQPGDAVPIEHGGTGSTTQGGAQTNLGVDAAGIKALYESNPDTNEYDDAEQTKLAGITAGAQVNTVDSVFGRTGAVLAVSGDYTATLVSVTPVGGISATDVQTAIAELDTEKAGVGHTHAASAITNTPAGGISATNTQDAINELDTEKSSVSHVHAASFVTFVPVGGIIATDVQAAIAELDAEKVAGPGSSTNNAIARFDTATGKLVQNSLVTIGDTGSIALPALETVDGRDLSVDGIKLDTIETSAKDDQTAGEIETAYESNPDTNKFQDAEKTKLDTIETSAKDDQSATEVVYSNTTSGLTATDVQAAIDELDGTLDGLAAGMVFKGSYDVGGGAGPINFPGAGSAEIGDYYVITNAAVGGTQLGTVAPKTVSTGDSVVASTNNASTSNGGDWHKLDNVDAVSSVFGRVGAITKVAGDYTASEITNVPAGSIAAITIQAAIDELDTEKSSTSHVHAAGVVTNTPAGDIAATDVQTAINELDTEKIPEADFLAKGNLLVGTGVGTHEALSSGTDGRALVSASGESSGLKFGHDLSKIGAIFAEVDLGALPISGEKVVATGAIIDHTKKISLWGSAKLVGANVSILLPFTQLGPFWVITLTILNNDIVISTNFDGSVLTGKVFLAYE